MIRIQMGNPTATSDQPAVATTRVIKASKFDVQQVYITLKSKEEQGREAWTSLHEYQGCSPTFVRDWEKLIPSYGCTCRKDYEEIKKLHPFDYSTPDRFFLSGIHLHNAVNRKLGKPEVSIEDARKIWNRPAT